METLDLTKLNISDKSKDNIDIIEKINGLSLKKRKQKVIEDLKKEDLNTKDLENLLADDNTNEDLICRYLHSLYNDLFAKPKDEISKEPKNDNLKEFYKIKNFKKILSKYSTFISIEKFKKLLIQLYGNKNLGFRNISFKDLFFNALLSFKKNKDFTLAINILKEAVILDKFNNQPFDSNNFEAFYYYICTLFLSQIKNNENEKEKYFKNLKKLIPMLQELDEYSNCKNYESEQKEFKKFLIIIFAILNLSSNNYDDIIQVYKVFNAPDDVTYKEMILLAKKEIIKFYDEKESEELLKEIENNKNFFKINYKLIEDKLELSEYCYLYDYISQNNVFTKYQKQLIDLLNIIYKSDLIKQLLKTVYGQDFEKLEHIFETEFSVEEFWENIILFIPFKMKRISGFCYRDIFKIFISIYKLEHFDTNLENEIFTLGAFIRTLIHESLGRLMVSYIFFMFYSNKENRDDYYCSPRMSNQIDNLNKKNYIELIGKELAKIEYDIINNINNKIKNEENKINSEELYKTLEQNLLEKFKEIVGTEYAKILSKKLTEKRREVGFLKNDD